MRGLEVELESGLLLTVSARARDGRAVERSAAAVARADRSVARRSARGRAPRRSERQRSRHVRSRGRSTGSRAPAHPERPRHADPERPRGESRSTKMYELSDRRAARRGHGSHVRLGVERHRRPRVRRQLRELQLLGERRASRPPRCAHLRERAASSGMLSERLSLRVEVTGRCSRRAVTPVLLGERRCIAIADDARLRSAGVVRLLAWKE